MNKLGRINDYIIHRSKKEKRLYAIYKDNFGMSYDEYSNLSYEDKIRFAKLLGVIDVVKKMDDGDNSKLKKKYMLGDGTIKEKDELSKEELGNIKYNRQSTFVKKLLKR